MSQSNLYVGGFLALCYPSRYPLAFKVFSSEPFKNTCHPTKWPVRNQHLHMLDWTRHCIVGKVELGAQFFSDYPFQILCTVETVKAKESWALVTSEKSVLGVKHSSPSTVLSGEGTGGLISLNVAVVGKLVLHASLLYPGTSMFAVVVVAACLSLLLFWPLSLLLIRAEFPITKL